LRTLEGGEGSGCGVPWANYSVGTLVISGIGRFGGALKRYSARNNILNIPHKFHMKLVIYIYNNYVVVFIENSLVKVNRRILSKYTLG
jgi:hypothetical protein